MLRVGKLALFGVQGVVAAGTFAGTLWFTSWILHAPASVVGSISNVVVLLAILVLVLAGGLTHELLYWRLPTLRFRKTLDLARRGAIPLEEVGVQRGGPAPLATPVQELLSEIKSLKQQIGELNLEMRQRVATRTDALERKLGVMKAKASRDALTGLSNRRSFDEELPAILDECRATRRDLVLMMIDVDYFKNLNDTLGHQAGDDLLRSIGQIIRSTIRDTDNAYRYGGDEFVVLLPGADAVSAHALSDRLKHLVDGLTRHHRHLNPRPALSVGMVSLFDLPHSARVEDLIARADAQLYELKRARPRPSRNVA